MQIEPDKVDLITFDPTGDEYALIVCTAGSWDDSEEEKERLLSKINKYYAFIASGQLLEQYPDAHGKPVRIQIDASSPIPESIDGLIIQVRDVLLTHGIKLRVNLLLERRIER